MTDILISNEKILHELIKRVSEHSPKHKLVINPEHFKYEQYKARQKINNSYPKLVTDIMTSYVEELFSCSRYVTKKKDIAQSLANRGFQTLEDLNVTDVTKLFNIEASPDDCIVSSIRRTISRDIIRKQNEGKLSLIHLKWNSNFNDSGDFLFKIDGRQIPADKILTFKYYLRHNIFSKIIKDILSDYYSHTFIITDDGNLKVLKLFFKEGEPDFYVANQIYFSIIQIIKEEPENIKKSLAKWLNMMMTDNLKKGKIEIDNNDDDDDEVILLKPRIFVSQK